MLASVNNQGNALYSGYKTLNSMKHKDFLFKGRLCEKNRFKYCERHKADVTFSNCSLNVVEILVFFSRETNFKKKVWYKNSRTEKIF